MYQALLSVGWVLLIGGCTFAPGWGSSDGPFPSSDSALHQDAASVDASPRPMGRCSTPGVLTETFDGALPRWKAVSATASNGRLTVSPPGSIASTSHIDLRDADAEVEVVAGAGAEFRLEFDDARYLAIRSDETSIRASTTSEEFSPQPYTSADRYWRISERLGTVTLQTSSTRVAWRVLGTVPTPPYATALRVVLATTSGTTPAQFGPVNANVASADWCKSKTLSDTFETIAIPPFNAAWNNTRANGMGCILTISGGAAHADQTVGAQADCSFGSSAAYDLTQSSASAYITAITNFQAGWRTYLAAVTDDGRRVEVAFRDNQLCASDHASVLKCIPYSTTYEYWRIREAAGNVLFEFSTDNANWMAFHELPAPFDLSAVTLRVGTASVQALLAPINLSISAINP